MNIPTPEEFAQQHGYKPFPGKWEKWLRAAREAILSAQPTAGRHVTVDEHPGKGTVINVADTSARRGGGPPPPPPPPKCPLNLHVTVCFDWFPVGYPPDFDCKVHIEQAIDIDMTNETVGFQCPTDFATSEYKTHPFQFPMTCTSHGADCEGFGTHAGYKQDLGMYWNAITEEWTIQSEIVLVEWTATFNYGPTIVDGRDLIGAGLITVVDQGCTADSIGHNPVAQITLQYF